MSGFDRNMSLDDLDFSVRTWNVLHIAGVRTFGDLLDKSYSDFAKMKHMSKRPLQEILDKLREFGVELHESDVVERYPGGVIAPKSFNGGRYWAEIRNDFLENGADIRAEDGDILARVSIDGLKHLGDWENEDSGVIAKVLLSKHGDVLVDYWHGAARTDAAAQEAIKEAKEQLKEYFKEHECSLGMGNGEWTRDNEGVPEFANSGTVKKDTGEVPKEVYCLCEEHEDSDAIREFSILAVSTDRDALRKLMEAKIVADDYDMAKNNGIAIHDEDHFLTEFDCGFVEYYIKEQKVLSKEELERMVQPSLDSEIKNANRIRAEQENSVIPINKDIER